MKKSNSTTNSEEKNKLLIGVIGLGRMGLMHAALFNSLPESKLASVADPSKMPAVQLGQLNPSISVYQEGKEMIEKEYLDGVLIASPVSSHIPLSILCMEKNIPFLLEKPLSINCNDAIPLMKKIDNSNNINMMGFCYRYIDSFSKAKQIYDSGCLGNIQKVTAHIYRSQLFKKGKGWRYDPKLSGGGVLTGLGSHVIDLLTWYFGPVISLVGKVKSVYSPGIEDFAHLIMEHQNGITSIVDCSWSVRFKRKIDTKIDILGDNGALIISEDTILLSLDKEAGGHPAGTITLNANDLFRPVPIDIGTPKFTFQNQYFLHCIINSKNPNPDIRQGYHVQQIVDAGYESSREGCIPIEIDSILN